jgi:bilirubin oxidase
MNGAAFTVLRLFVTATTANPETTAPPSSLGSDTPIPEAQSTFSRNKWLFSGNGVNGVRIGPNSNYSTTTAFDMNVINDVIPLDQTEIWTLHGAADQYHPFHIHDIQFYILDRKDSLGNNITLTSNEIGRKDVVYVGPKETVRFITQFDDFWGDVPYMYHCHITVHEDKGMMKQFIVNRSLYVNKDYTGAIETGSQSFPFKTLRGAVNAAQEGTTIYFISSGIHEEITSPSLITLKKIIIKLLGTGVTVK